MSTPRTDAVKIRCGFQAVPEPMLKHAQELERENAELQATFDLMYSANQRGIKAWRESHPESAMVWPDQSKLVEWLLTENAALRRDVYQCPPTSENDYEGFKWRDACEELERENAALREAKDMVELERCEMMRSMSLAQNYCEQLRADKERLDWLDHNAIPWNWMSPEKIDGLGPIVVTWKSNRTLRAAIDAAQKEAQP